MERRDFSQFQSWLNSKEISSGPDTIVDVINKLTAMQTMLHGVTQKYSAVYNQYQKWYRDSNNNLVDDTEPRAQEASDSVIDTVISRLRGYSSYLTNMATGVNVPGNKAHYTQEVVPGVTYNSMTDQYTFSDSHYYCASQYGYSMAQAGAVEVRGCLHFPSGYSILVEDFMTVVAPPSTKCTHTCITLRLYAPDGTIVKSAYKAGSFTDEQAGITWNDAQGTPSPTATYIATRIEDRASGLKFGSWTAGKTGNFNPTEQYPAVAYKTLGQTSGFTAIPNGNYEPNPVVEEGDQDILQYLASFFPDPDEAINKLPSTN